MKQSNTRDIVIGRKGRWATIVPFAQREMVDRFMEGIDPEFLTYLRDKFREQLSLFGKGVLDAYNLTNENRLQVIRGAVDKMASEYLRAAEQFQAKNFVNPVMDIVRHLPKEELGSIAEALVNLTSLKHRVAQGQETVGGPVDVAVISKGDGFVWVRRKHYFDPALNLHYIHNQAATHRQGEMP